MTIMKRPKFLDSEYFVPEVDNWHLKPNAPLEIVKEFNEWMNSYDETPVGKAEKKRQQVSDK